MDLAILWIGNGYETRDGWRTMMVGGWIKEEQRRRRRSVPVKR